MLRIYDLEHSFLALLTDGIRNISVTESLETGYKTLRFQVPCKEEYLALVHEEYYVETADYEYIIKELVLEDNDFFSVYCTPNIEEIAGYVFSAFDVLDMNYQQAYQYCLVNLPAWTIEYHSQNMTAITVQLPNVSALEMLRYIQEEADQELWFDTKNKIIHVYNRMGSIPSTSYYMNEISLRRLVKQSSTYDYATVVYPYGKDGLDIKLVNNNKAFIEDYTYSNKRIIKVWRDETIDRAERLLAAAQDYLYSVASPQTSYKVELSKLKPTTQLGDTLTLVDDLKHERVRARVVKIVHYPLEPERDEVEIANRAADFAHTFVKSQKVTRKELRYIHKLLKELQAQIDEL